MAGGSRRGDLVSGGLVLNEYPTPAVEIKLDARQASSFARSSVVIEIPSSIAVALRSLIGPALDCDSTGRLAIGGRHVSLELTGRPAFLAVAVDN